MKALFLYIDSENVFKNLRTSTDTVSVSPHNNFAYNLHHDNFSRVSQISWPPTPQHFRHRGRSLPYIRCFSWWTSRKVEWSELSFPDGTRAWGMGYWQYSIISHTSRPCVSRKAECRSLYPWMCSLVKDNQLPREQFVYFCSMKCKNFFLVH